MPELPAVSAPSINETDSHAELLVLLRDTVAQMDHFSLALGRQLRTREEFVDKTFSDLRNAILQVEVKARSAKDDAMEARVRVNTLAREVSSLRTELNNHQRPRMDTIEMREAIEVVVGRLLPEVMSRLYTPQVSEAFVTRFLSENKADILRYLQQVDWHKPVPDEEEV